MSFSRKHVPEKTGAEIQNIKNDTFKEMKIDGFGYS